jgi:hypothetical protein
MGRIRADFLRYLSRRSPHARRTRPAFQHIWDSQNRGFVVRRTTCDL